MKKSLLALFFLGMFFVGQSQNTPPVALDGKASGPEDGGVITGSVTADDADGNALTYSLESDVTVGSGPATISITVNPVNGAPTLSDVIMDNENEDVVVTFTAEDFSSNFNDADGDDLTKIQITSLPSNGTLKLDGNNVTLDQEINLSDLGTLTFVPAANYNGSVSFTWNGYDGGTYAANPANVNITLNAVNDAPVANNGSASGPEDGGAITGSVTANDADGNALTYSVVSGVTAAQGTLSLNPTTGAYSFTPTANYNGIVTFTFKANDGTVDSGPATVTITVVPVNDAPSFTKGADQTKPEDPGPQTVTGWATNISAGPSNESGQFLSFVVTNNNPGLFTTAGQPKIDATTGTLTYTPALDVFGQAIVTVVLKDDGGTPNDPSDDKTSASQEFTITITPVRDAGDRKILINEVYTDPNDDSKSEFFELYNTSIDQTPIQLDCFTLAVFYKDKNGSRGFYVIDLPKSTIAAKQFYVGASNNPFNAQGKTGIKPDFSWSNIGPTGFLRKYRFNGTGYDDVTSKELNSPKSLNDIFQTGSGGNLAAFLFNKGVYVHGITIGFGKNTTVTEEITSLPGLKIPFAGDLGSNCGSEFIADWKNAVNVAEYNPGGQQGGQDNGFARAFDGNCGSWVKTAASNNGGGITHTPGTTNTPANAEQYSILTTSQNIICGTRLDYSVRSSDPNVFPVDMRIYEDVNKNGIFDLGDLLVGSPITISSSMAAVQSVSGLDPNKAYLVVYNTNLGCSDAILPPSTNLGITTAQYSYCNQQFGAAITAANEVALANAFPVTVNFYNTVGGVKTLIGSGSISAPSTVQVYSNFSPTPYTPANISIEYVPKSSSCLATTTVANVAATSFVNVTGSLQTNERFVLLNPNTAGSPGKMEVRVTGITTSGPGFVAANVVPVTANLYYDKDPAKTTDDVLIESMTINDFSTQYQQFQKVFTKADLDANGQYLVVTYTANMKCLTNRSPEQSMQVLPVKFSAFTASRNAANKSQVQLEWETAMEQNNQGFYLQRMTRGEWQDIGFVNTAATGGNSNVPLKYRYNDVNLFAGTTYYRMYQVDFDGKADYSEVKSVDGQGLSNKSVMIYPNPAYGGSTTVLFASDTPKQILLNDAKGRIIQQWRNYTGSRLGISQLKPGFYTLRIQDGAHGSPVIEKIIVQ